MSDHDFTLDPSKFPKRVDLTLPPEIEAKLEEMALRSGRSIDEVILEILDRSMSENKPPDE